MGDYDGRTALHLAAAEGHIRCVRFLLVSML
jgi:glutaminase